MSIDPNYLIIFMLICFYYVFILSYYEKGNYNNTINVIHFQFANY